MGGGGDDVSIRDGAFVDAGGDQTGDVGHVHHQHRTHAVGDLPELFKVDGPGIGGSAGNDHFGPALLSGLIDRLIIELLGVLVQGIGDDMIQLAGKVDGGAMGQVAAVGKIHAHDRVARLDRGEIGRQVGVGAGVGLDVGVVGAKQPAGPAAGQLLGLVHAGAAAVIPFAGITLGIFVGQAGAHGGHHSRTDDVFGSDQLHILLLAGKLLADGPGHLGVSL